MGARPMSEQPGCLPNLLVIGAMNAGTTSFYHYLRFHPDIRMSVISSYSIHYTKLYELIYSITR